MGWVVNTTPWPLYRRERPGTHCTGRSMGPPGPVWTGAEKLAPNGIRSSNRPAPSESLYRLLYPSARTHTHTHTHTHTQTHTHTLTHRHRHTDSHRHTHTHTDTHTHTYIYIYIVDTKSLNDSQKDI
jgi:hypothetical protein